ncbi:MAG: hypothetical protein FWF53_02525 [Candidatus Azobacteroides sp.]|nr:hypothetical protein [Candidatus Azobacteroides sp.]
MAVGDFLSKEGSNNLFKSTLAKGNVFCGEFAGIEHKKYFIVVGLSNDKLCLCSVYINSSILDFIYNKQELLNLQVPIKGVKYDFLKYDSFVSCNTQLKYEFTDIRNWIDSGKCQYIGNIDNEDLSNITFTLIESGLLTQKEIDLYF